MWLRRGVPSRYSHPMGNVVFPGAARAWSWHDRRSMGPGRSALKRGSKQVNLSVPPGEERRSGVLRLRKRCRRTS